MKTVKISEFNWNVACPHCGEPIETQNEDFDNGDIVKCSFCGKKSQIQLVNSIKEAEERL